MKCLLLSDIHGDINNLKKVLTYYETFECEKILIMGDELYHGPRKGISENYDPVAVANVLNEYKDVITACRGNCDAEVDQMLLQYPMMADYELVEVNGHHCMLSHGHLFNEDMLPRLPFEIYLSGHTHVPVLERRNNGILYCNPGAVTFPKSEVGSSFGIMDEKGISLYTIDGIKFKELLF